MSAYYSSEAWQVYQESAFPAPRPRRAGLTVEQQAQIIELYSRRDASLRTVAAKVHVSPSTVAGVLRANDLPRRHQGGSRPKLTNEQLLEVGELYALGNSQQQIASMIGVCRSTVHYRLMRLGARMRSRSESARLGRQHNREMQ